MSLTAAAGQGEHARIKLLFELTVLWNRQNRFTQEYGLGKELMTGWRDDTAASDESFGKVLPMIGKNPEVLVREAV